MRSHHYNDTHRPAIKILFIRDYHQMRQETNDIQHMTGDYCSKSEHPTCITSRTMKQSDKIQISYRRCKIVPRWFSLDTKQASQASFLMQAAEGKVSHTTAECAGVLKGELSVWGMHRISGLPAFAFYIQFHMIWLTEWLAAKTRWYLL